MNSLVTIFFASALLASSSVFGADKNITLEGTISATIARAGTEPAHFLFTRKANQVRIENTTNRLEPINILDLEARKLTIVFPHNTTFVSVDLGKVGAPAGGPLTPPNFPTPPAVNAPPSGATPGQIGPQPSSQGYGAPGLSPRPEIPAPPSMPPMPQMPNNSGPGSGAMPAMPMMPPMPGMGGAAELKKTDNTKKIQGFECTLYTLSDRGQTLEIWATDAAPFFPFRLLQRDYMSRHFGPQMLEEQWPELLQKKSLFPLEATLRMEPNGQERFSFKVDKIEKTKIDNGKLFEPPEGFHEMQVPQLL